MKPKIYFVLRPIVFLFFAILIFAAVVYFLSFLFFIFKINVAGALTTFGLRGFESLFFALPWGIIVLILFFIVIFEVIIYKVAYRKPVLYSLLAMVILIFGISFLIHCTSFHANLFSLNKQHALPGIGPLYEMYERMDFRGVYCGIVSRITENGFEVQWVDDPNVKFKVNVPPDFTKYKDLEKGDIVILFGKREDSTIKLVDLTEVESEIFCIHRRELPR